MLTFRYKTSFKRANAYIFLNLSEQKMCYNATYQLQQYTKTIYVMNCDKYGVTYKTLKQYPKFCLFNGKKKTGEVDAVNFRRIFHH